MFSSASRLARSGSRSSPEMASTRLLSICANSSADGPVTAFRFCSVAATSEIQHHTACLGANGLATRS